MKHFVSHVRPSNKDKVLLLLDNYHSHVTLETIDYDKEYGIVFFHFHPIVPIKCSHLIVQFMGLSSVITIALAIVG